MVVDYEKEIAELQTQEKSLLAYLNRLNQSLHNEKRIFHISGANTKIEIGDGVSVSTKQINPIFLKIKNDVIISEGELASIKQEIKERNQILKILYKQIDTIKKELAKKELERKRLISEYKAIKKTFDILTSKLGELKIAENAISASVKIAIKAFAPKYPVKPKIKQNILISFVVSIFVAIFLSFLIEFISRNKNHFKEVISK